MKSAASPDDALANPERDAWIAWVLLALASALFVAFNVVFLPRLTNVHFGDVEFTGWSGPMGSRLLRGDRPYIDFVLPIPPGSFVLLAVIQKIAGRPTVLQELGLDAGIHLLMGLLAYVMARAVTSRSNAVLTSIATLVTVIQLNKECAYDHTAQVVAWGSVTAGLWALVSTDIARRRRYWVLAGALAGFTVAFKQSTGIGCIIGWLAAIGYLAAVELLSGARDRARTLKEPLLAYIRGLGLGLSGVWLMLLLLGSTARAFFQAVFLDGSTLKGGALFLLRNLVIYLFDYEAYPASLVFIAAFVVVGARLIAKRGTLHIGDEIGQERPYRPWEAFVVGSIVVTGFGAGIYFLCFGPPSYPTGWISPIDRLKGIPSLTLIPACAIFIAHLQEPRAKEPTRNPVADPWRAGHAINAAFIAGFSCTLMHNTSAPEFRPYYDNNVIIPLTFMTAFVVLGRADLRPISIILLLFTAGGVAGNKYFRAMAATTRMGSTGYWAGMRVGEHGAQIARVAARVRALTKPTDTVLVLPEDLEIEAIIGRSRPPLIGAVVFVDQYAPRLVKDDIARLDENPPRVIVVHPREKRSWQRFFRIWSGHSGAEQVISHVLRKLLPDAYERDSSYGTTFLWAQETLDVYVRRDGPPLGQHDEARESPPPGEAP
jgi:hypothetical protein